jgi:D-alanyl-D-alanine carboxypeptidase
MDKESQLKLTFVSLMVILAVFGKTDSRNNLVNNTGDKPEANVFNSVKPLPVAGKPISIGKTANLDRQIQSAVPYRNSQNNSDPFLSVQAAFAKDLDSDFVFYKFNGGLNWPFASLTKLMSAVVAIEQVGLEKPVVINEATVATEGVAGNAGGFQQ